jgi:DNA end-binding protein Ku
VKAYTAVRDHDAHVHQLEKQTGARIRYKKLSEKTDKEVDPDEIEMAFEIRQGRHVTFTKDELADLRPESTRISEVSDFSTSRPSIRSTTTAPTRWGPTGCGGRHGT